MKEGCGNVASWKFSDIQFIVLESLVVQIDLIYENFLLSLIKFATNSHKCDQIFLNLVITTFELLCWEDKTVYGLQFRLEIFN